MQRLQRQQACAKDFQCVASWDGQSISRRVD
jgi:hypothetical protein